MIFKLKNLQCKFYCNTICIMLFRVIPINQTSAAVNTDIK